ncbi:hypothetical protein HPP92_001374 [Vanilla planifolia]|uniref:Uncharacterized protein n=1 Tax=Vanilla planifolia TaxID=51239 RepID=A0A835SCT2_VANPL|nr:hypothetical protein HPP92_001374 [Vanilla planifolia]
MEIPCTSSLTKTTTRLQLNNHCATIASNNSNRHRFTAAGISTSRFRPQRRRFSPTPSNPNSAKLSILAKKRNLSPPQPPGAFSAVKT